MPELPEVETVRRSLQKILPRIIERIYLSPVAPVETTTPAAIRRAVRGSTIQSVGRHGKYLLFDMGQDRSLVVHLGMSGRIMFLAQSSGSREKHTHLELQFLDGTLLRYIDARRFGTISLASNHNNPFLERIGPDYLDRQLTTASYVKRCRCHPGLSLKALLLNQGVAAGMGNIYACEALYQARLDPRRRVATVSDDELRRLLKAIRATLRLGIRYGGTTFRDYLDGRGHRGKMQDFLQVYGREGRKTLDGAGLVKKITQQARSTFYCPAAQH